MTLKESVSVYFYAKAVGQKPKLVYERIRLGQIHAKRVGKRGVWRISKAELVS